MSLLKLEMQVKEWRLEVRSDGKWTSLTGQWMKERAVRVERDLRDVTDNERSSEQLERVREVRWRNGVEESHVVVVGRWGVGVQGSFEVGMLREWRAFSWSGSRVGVTAEEVAERRRSRWRRR